MPPFSGRSSATKGFRPGYEAKGVEPLVTALMEAHRAVVGGDPPAVSGPTASMWRDSNVFAELEHVPPQLNQGDSRGAEDGRGYRH